MKKRNSSGKYIAGLILLIALCVFGAFITTKGITKKKIGRASNIELGLDLAGGVSITYEVDGKNVSDSDMKDTVYKLQKRVEGYSTEAEVYQEGKDRINIEIPGVTDANKILDELGKPGTLSFAVQKQVKVKKNGKTTTQTTLDTVLTGQNVKKAKAVTNQNQTTGKKEYLVALEFDAKGTKAFAKATKANIGKPIYIIYDNQVISAPNVQEAITKGECTIDGMESYEAAENLASSIRIGSLPVKLNELRSNVVSAKLGVNAIQTTVKAGVIGFVLVCLIMIAFYAVPGVIACVALAIYMLMMLLALNGFNATLTLPGLAGIILGIGMAVDANVIIYTRIREEIAAGKSVESAILAGYNKATSAIVDGNVTTLIAAIVLYIFGTGPVKGFATTLAVGNIVSIFTALVITKVIMKLLYNFGLTKPSMYGKTVHRRTYNILSIRKWTITVSVVLIVVGFVAMGVQSAAGNRALNFSLEFVGGSTTSFTFDKEYSQSEIENGIIPIIREAAGITEVQQQKVQNSTKVTFKTTDLSLEQREAIETAVTEKYPLQDGSIVESDTISSSVSSTMKKNAILSVVLATIAMLIYIFARFRDIKFALAAVMALLQDVLVVITFYAVFRVPVGNTFIACMLTIVGYSINGTIIIFDRIREMLKSANSKTNITELVNSAVTSTITRNINTTITTLIMLVMLYIMGVTSVKEFSLPLIVGIICGLYSSVFLTS